ncbi:hypothetical protein [Promicromonospora sp. NPDC060271]|uniref:hypothetical protein n=1 Tax=Promicromonospora sp. NPDC060271 TaxID=3347089 RepID=UPI00365ED597
MSITAEGGVWAVPELARELGALPLDDPFDKLEAALGAALGAKGRDALQAMIGADLDKR